ncbi:MAG TPA: putative lipid II flippase FtsW [Candidatus Omnitrophota bacterium]|nr:putative lipid II flippase FtsW [Candidatus Omnitrophota bacterium]
MRSIRISIAVIVITLIFIGILMIYSSSGVYAMQELGDSLYFLKRHMVFLAAGTVLMFLMMMIDYRHLQAHSKVLLLCGILGLVMVLLPGLGRSTFGAQRWIRLGPINIQPSEFMKLAAIIYVADFLARKKSAIVSFEKGLLPILLVVGVISVLIMKQPDLGSTVLIASVVLIMAFIAGARFQQIAWLGLLFIPAFYFLIYRVPYRWRRIVGFLDPWKDPMGTGFQLTQSQIAFGSGGVFGVGPGKSMQKLFYLPAAHTDFILSIIGEEFGFIGAFVIILLFTALILQGARIAKRVNDEFGYFLAIGIVLMIGLQAMVNIGVSIGALPTKGLPLPFISYGGSALVVNMMMVGLLLNISRISDLES